MTDRPPDPVDAALQADLDAWFQGEVRQAAADLRRSPLRPTRARVVPARGVAGPAVAATLVVIVVVAGISRLPAFSGPLAEPTNTSPPTASPANSESSTPSGAIGTPRPTVGLGDRYQDGIPAFIDGELVRRQAMVGGSSFPDDGSSFLVGGWLLHTEAVRTCLAPQPSLEPCGNPVISSTPLETVDSPSVHLGARILEAGPVVLRVHANDPQAAECQLHRIAECRAVLVVDDVSWTSDGVTQTGPISTIHALNRVQALVPELAVLERAVDPRLFDPATSCNPGFPVQTWTTPGLRIAQILVFPSVGERAAVDDNFNASGYRGTDPRDNGPCLVTTDSLYSHQWVVGQNVMVAVQIDVDGATPAQSRLVDDIRTSLEPRSEACSAGISCSGVTASSR